MNTWILKIYSKLYFTYSPPYIYLSTTAGMSVLTVLASFLPPSHPDPQLHRAKPQNAADSKMNWNAKSSTTPCRSFLSFHLPLSLSLPLLPSAALLLECLAFKFIHKPKSCLLVVGGSFLVRLSPPPLCHSLLSLSAAFHHWFFMYYSCCCCGYIVLCVSGCRRGAYLLLLHKQVVRARSQCAGRPAAATTVAKLGQALD